MAKVHGLFPTDIIDDTSAVRDATSPAAVLSVLADPTRLAILSHLRGGEHRVSELTEHLGLAQSTVSELTAGRVAARPRARPAAEAADGDEEPA